MRRCRSSCVLWPGASCYASGDHCDLTTCRGWHHTFLGGCHQAPLVILTVPRRVGRAAAWLKRGYDIVQTEPFNFKQDHLMPARGRSTLKVQAKYADLMRCTRAVLACMRKPVALDPGEEHAGDGMRFKLVDE
eukprot:2079299-Karenia_brevis.AAC.1